MDNWRDCFGEEWDVVVLGTGMKECLLSGLLSVDGKKVLHLDRNAYYGGASASLLIGELYKKFNDDEQPNDKQLGSLRDYSVDMVPKFIMGDGMLVKTLIHTGVQSHLDFQGVTGSFVFRRGNINKVPVTPKEALGSPLMTVVEKKNCAQFFQWVDQFDPKDSKTWTCGYVFKTNLPMKTMTGAEFFKYWSFEQDTIDFITHALALYTDESYFKLLAVDIVMRVKLYKDSLIRYPGLTTPYLYPQYGLGELPQAFARLAAVHGGTYMLNRDMDGTGMFKEGDLSVEYEGGRAVGVKAQDVMARCKIVVGDPSYFPGKAKTTCKVVRAIALIPHPINDTNNADSCQVIFPANQLKRKSDIYLFCCSSKHRVCPANHWLAFASTTVDNISPSDCDGMTAQQVAEQELAAALPYMKPWDKIFYDMYDYQVPLESGEGDGVYISQSFDATSHFQTAIADVLDMYKRITGKDLEFKVPPPQE